MFNKLSKKSVVAITGISDARTSRYGGTYRYIYAMDSMGRNLHPASLSTQMQNYDEWETIVEILETKNRSESLLCEDARIIQRDGKTMLDCDWAPRELELI